MIHTLPPEVWLSIFKNLQWPQHELASMMYISAYTKNIVEILLYEHPEIGNPLKDLEISHLVEQFHRSITKGDEHLADVVQSLHLFRFCKSGSDNTCLTTPLLMSLRNLKHLSVLFCDMVLIPPAVDPSCQFASITHLSYSTELEDPVAFAAFLGSLPSLEYMKSWGDSIRSVPLAPEALSRLRHLEYASFDFAVSVLTGRQVPHIGLYFDDLEPLIPLVNDGEDYSTLRDMFRCVESLSIVSEHVDPITLIICSSYFQGIKYLQVRSEHPMPSVDVVLDFTGTLQTNTLNSTSSVMEISRWTLPGQFSPKSQR
ncbi:hypothetical protein BDN71DRAFT_86075 [Pleurotus eryngii]|uniref:F-box domain-containing protein n=1 Tax=Pleurotus eryngii TaxID=5323 RepID=A0A9P6D4Z4_PLEER|nr:hypothetical protein BDN71DRAFT_86075 [Pleurotus eryngii]